MLAAVAATVKFLILFRDPLLQKGVQSFEQISRLQRAACCFFLGRQHSISIFFFHILYACVCMVIYVYVFRTFFLFSLFDLYTFNFFFFGSVISYDYTFQSQQFNFTLLSVPKPIGCVYPETLRQRILFKLQVERG